jgi:hypothetical protein
MRVRYRRQRVAVPRGGAERPGSGTPQRRARAPIKPPEALQEIIMVRMNNNVTGCTTEKVALACNEMVLCMVGDNEGAAMERLMESAGVECRLVPNDDGVAVLIEEIDVEIAELLLAKRKKDVEEEDELDDEEEEDDEDDVDDDEDDDFDDDEDEFEEEFEDDELDDDEEDIFYDDDDDE